VATSRQRERELARRRYERRRLREQQLRARRRRRNTVIGAISGTTAVIVGLVFAGLALAGAGPFSSSKAKVTTQPTPSSSASPSASPAPPAPTKCAKIKPNPPAKGQPVVPDVVGKAPTSLRFVDVKQGTGKAAKNGSTINVLYIGISCSTGTVFDASFKHGNSAFPVTLGKGSVIPGWDKGLIGVKAGGVRELIIPPALGYGPAGQGPIKGNEVLIFLVTVKSVK
jgi:peptidylprolyl isomerase